MQKRLADRKIEIELDDEAKSWLLREGYEPMFGARPLRRAIQRHVENPLSNRILSKEFKDGDRIFVSVDGDKLTFSSKRNSRKKAMATK